MVRKKTYIGLAIILVLISMVTLVFLQKNKVSKPTEKIRKTEETAIVPTIDSSVIVSLQSVIPEKEVLLKIENIPSKTSTIEYELSYQTAKQGLQGVIGTITLTNEREYEKKLTLGTCSSGTCVYHQVVGKVNVTLKFSGEYGEKLFEKEYEI